MVGGETILVVDDDAAILQMLAMILEEAGYEVMKASDGAEALELVKVRRPDLVLLDFMMPNLDGCTACERLKTAEETQGLPVVIMSADRQVVGRAAKANADACLLKPFSIEQILDCIRDSLENYSPPPTEQ